MKYFLFLTALLTLSQIPSIHSNEIKEYPLYVSGGVNLNFVEKDWHLDRGYSTNIALGCWLSEILRLEGEVGYRKNDFKSDKYYSSYFSTPKPEPKEKTDALNIMLNLYAELDLNTAFKPYVGAGLGNSIRRLYNNEGSNHTYSPKFTYQLIGGFKYPIDTRFALSIEYRFIETTHYMKEHSFGLLLTYKL